MGRSFAARSADTELMDTETVSLDDYRACLKDLAQVNALTLTHGPVLRWLDQATRHLDPERTLTIVDVGYGYGDLLRRIHGWGKQRGRRLNLVGIDLNPMSAPIARDATPPDVRIEYREGNVFDYKPELPVDLVVSSQTTHHLSDAELARFVAWMENVSRVGWFIADLHRHAVPYHAFRLLSRLARWHRFVQHDGPVSIARSFRRDDWRRIVQSAGLRPDSVSIRWHVPFRLCVSHLK